MRLLPQYVLHITEINANVYYVLKMFANKNITFLLCCTLYKELINTYNITSSMPNSNVFTNNMSNYSTLSIYNVHVAKFLHETFILREDKINI